MRYYFKTWHIDITADLADSELRDQWLFAEQEDAACAATNPPNTNATKGNRLVQRGLPLSSVPSLSGFYRAVCPSPTPRRQSAPKRPSGGSSRWSARQS